MIVTRDTARSILAHLSVKSELAIDTETTGLRPYHGDKPFSLIVYDGENGYYFNFHDYGGDPNVVLSWEEMRLPLTLFFATPRVYYFHNAKFDLAMLSRMGVEVGGVIHDTMAIQRVVDSVMPPWGFSLEELAARIGETKDEAVRDYLVRHKYFTVEVRDGKKTSRKLWHYDKAPLELIHPYGVKDAAITWKLARRQLRDVEDFAATTPEHLPSVGAVLENERRLTRTVFEMERRGVLVDRAFCREAIRHCDTRMREAEETFQREAGEPFRESPLVYQRVFAPLKDRWVYGEVTKTGKRNPSFDSDVLKTFGTPLAEAVLTWRKAKSDANYFHGFLYAADPDGVIHANLNQHVAVHGRFSSSEPNLQNLTKPDEDDLAAADALLVRRAIVPRPGMVFHMLDYDQVEYRLMLNFAALFAADKTGVMALIKKVLVEGLDVHQATADGAGLTRKSAKGANFAIIYGSGDQNLADTLGITLAEAKRVRRRIFDAAPEIETYVRKVMKTAEIRGYIVNWFGRRCEFPDANLSYRAPNYHVAGGVADVVKVAMNRIDDYLLRRETKLVLMIHDELVLEGPPGEAAEVIPEVRRIMEAAYPARFLPLTCGVDHSFKSLADKVEGVAPCTKSS